MAEPKVVARGLAPGLEGFAAGALLDAAVGAVAWPAEPGAASDAAAPRAADAPDEAPVVRGLDDDLRSADAPAERFFAELFR